MGHSASQSLKDLRKKPDLVVVSPSAPDAMMKFPAECRELGIPYLYDPSQQVLRLEGAELARDMEGASFLFCNDYEFGLISKKTGRDLQEILKHVKVLVVTRGKDGAESVHTRDRRSSSQLCPSGDRRPDRCRRCVSRRISWPDYGHGWDWKLCGEVGALAAVYCLECRGPQSHSFTRAEFVERFRKHFDDQGRLDDLLKKPVRKPARRAPRPIQKGKKRK